ncbi:hypothetical protein B1VFA_040 [Rhizobium phage B1VFA]|nr:hypothetical protein B1VFA_040 [Rhizobium phage B1VFA]
MSQKLPDGWTETKGVSCAGWDIWAAFNLSRPEGQRFAIFRRRIAEQEHLDMGTVYPTTTQLDAALDKIRRTLSEGKYTFDDLFPEEQLTRHPNYGTF